MSAARTRHTSGCSRPPNWSATRMVTSSASGRRAAQHRHGEARGDRAGQGPEAAGDGQPRQVRVPLQHEPRNPHAAQRCDGRGRARSRIDARSEPARDGWSDRKLRQDAGHPCFWTCSTWRGWSRGAWSWRPSRSRSSSASPMSARSSSRARRPRDLDLIVEAPRPTSKARSRAMRRGCGAGRLQPRGQRRRSSRRPARSGSVASALTTPDGIEATSSGSRTPGIGFDADTKDAALRPLRAGRRIDHPPLRRHRPGAIHLALAGPSAYAARSTPDAEPGAGAVFTRRLPLTRRWKPGLLSCARDRWPRTAWAATCRLLKVLLAEDHPINRRVVQLILEAAGVDLTCVENGEEAGRGLVRRRLRPYPDGHADARDGRPDRHRAICERERQHADAGRAPRSTALTANAMPETTPAHSQGRRQLTGTSPSRSPPTPSSPSSRPPAAGPSAGAPTPVRATAS